MCSVVCDNRGVVNTLRIRMLVIVTIIEPRPLQEGVRINVIDKCKGSIEPCPVAAYAASLSAHSFQRSPLRDLAPVASLMVWSVH